MLRKQPPVCVTLWAGCCACRVCCCAAGVACHTRAGYGVCQAASYQLPTTLPHLHGVCSRDEVRCLKHKHSSYGLSMTFFYPSCCMLLGVLWESSIGVVMGSAVLCSSYPSCCCLAVGRR
jgi:hypothetical protein